MIPAMFDEALRQLKAVEPHELILRAKVGESVIGGLSASRSLVGCEYSERPQLVPFCLSLRCRMDT